MTSHAVTGFDAILAGVDAGQLVQAIHAAQRWSTLRWEERRDFHELQPPDRAVSPRHDARWWSAWALVALADPYRHEEAERWADWALEEDPSLGFAHYLRALALWERRHQGVGVCAEAAIELDEALERGFVEALVFEAQAGLALYRDDQPAAAAAAKAALELDPVNVRAYQIRTTALACCGQAAVAREELAALPPEFQAQPCIASLRAWTEMQCGRFAAAEEILDSARAQSPDDPELLAQQTELLKAHRWWYRPLVYKDLWLQRQGLRGEQVRQFASGTPVFVAIVGWIVLLVAIPWLVEATGWRMVAGWLAFTLALLLGVYTCVHSRIATDWWLWLWRDPVVLRAFDHRPSNRDNNHEDLASAAVLLMLAAVLAGLVGLRGLGITALGAGISLFWAPLLWQGSRGPRRWLGKAFLALGLGAMAWAIVPMYVGWDHPLSGIEILLVGLGANLISAGVHVIYRAHGWMASAMLGAAAMAAYLRSMVVGESGWLSALVILATIWGLISLVAAWVVAVNASADEEPAATI